MTSGTLLRGGYYSRPIFYPQVDWTASVSNSDLCLNNASAFLADAKQVVLARGARSDSFVESLWASNINHAASLKLSAKL